MTAVLLCLSLSPQVPALSPGEAAEPLAAITSTARSYVRSLLPGAAGDTRITVGTLDHRLRLARCDSAPTARLAAGANLQARITVAIACAGPVRWSVYVPVLIESRITVLVLKHAAARDSHLTGDDVEVQRRQAAGMATAYLSSVQELEGRSTRRPLAVGTALSTEMFVADTIVHRGQEVTLVASGGSLEVRATGRALMDAAAGQRIEVQNLNSSKIVEGVVESADVVRVAL